MAERLPRCDGNREHRKLSPARQAVWLRMRETYLFDRPSLGKFIRLAYLALTFAIPLDLKKILHPLIPRLRALLPGGGHSASFSPYELRISGRIDQDRRRILHALGNVTTGGSSRLVVDIIEHLSCHYEQEVITGYIPSPPHYRGMKATLFTPHAGPDGMARYLSTHRPDLLHVHYWGESDLKWYQNVFAAAQRTGCRVIENVNTPVRPFASDNIERYIFVSDYVRRSFGSETGKDLTIYPGSDFSVFSRTSGSEPPDDCIGMVYRLEADKLDEHAMDVFIKVVRRRPGTRVLIVGGGTFLNRYQAAARTSGAGDAFTFTGYVSYDRLPALYEKMSIFVAPVWKESFGQVSPFAMHMGMPVAGYDIGALSEIIGDSELLAPCGDSDRLAEIIVRLLDDRPRRLEIGRRNRARADAKFSIESMISSYKDLYRSLLGGPG